MRLDRQTYESLLVMGGGREIRIFIRLRTSIYVNRETADIVENPSEHDINRVFTTSQEY